MRNPSESPDANEQVSTSAVKSRSSTRSKTESATPGNQDKEAKPVVQRRTASAATSAAPAAPATPAVRSQDDTSSITPVSSVAKGATTTQRTSGSGTTTQRQSGSPPVARSATTAPANATPVTAQQPSNNATSTSPQRSPGKTTGAFPQRQPDSIPGTSPQRSPGKTTGSFPQRSPGSSNTGPSSQRQPGGATGPSSQRQPGSATGTSPQRLPGNAPTGPRAMGTGITTRPATRQGSTPSGTQRPTNARPSGHAPARPGTRSGAPTQRPQERRQATVKEKPTGPIAIPPQIVVKDLAELMKASPNEVIRNLIKHSIFASINQVVDYDKAALVAQDLGFEPQQSTLTATPAVQGNRGLSANEQMLATHNEDNMVVIPPVVTIMGHVDHGKTSLLDTIRKTKVAAGEAGGITQHIGAYQVEVNGKKITFLDTPGHEAFTAMRARGAQVTHIAIIVVAADDGVMPQTREAIDHAQAAKVPIIIALNKIDKIDANPDRVKQQLAEIGLVIEEYGGEIICVSVSARKGTGIDELLEMILLLAEVQEIKANPNRPATGVIIEAKLEKSTGPTATVLIQQGTLKMGDNIVVGALAAKVRAMFNDRGKRIQKAPPSMPVSILGLPEVPQAGDHLEVVADERTAKQKATVVAQQRRNESMPLGQVSLDTLYMQMQEGTVKELDIVLKCDVQGSAEALKNALSKLGEDNLKVRLIHEGIGNINETDVHLAAASGAIVIGFNVKADGAAQRQAQKEGVDIRYYNVIYKLTDDIQAALNGMLEPTYREVVEGHAEVQQTFKAGKSIVIAGCRVLDGKIIRSSQIRLMRKSTKVYEGKIASLKRGKDDVREVASGYECGIVLEEFNEYEIGDIIETFAQERVKPGM